MKITYYITRSSGIPTQQRDPVLPELIGNNSDNYTIGQMGFKSSKQGRQELPEMILQFMIDKMYYSDY